MENKRTKHTPGPWVKDHGGTLGHIKSIAPHEKGWTPTVARYDCGVVMGKKYEYVIQDEEEREANGYMLAAAPKMYEVLQHIRENWKTLSRKEWDEIAEALASVEGR